VTHHIGGCEGNRGIDLVASSAEIDSLEIHQHADVIKRRCSSIKSSWLDHRVTNGCRVLVRVNVVVA
jgi:hypothetical protein